jgi:uncharacterized coiled-coil protein SlyX
MTTNDNTPEKSTTGDTCPWCNSPRFRDNVFHCGNDLNRKHFREPLCFYIEAKNQAEQESNTLLNFNNIKAERITELEAELAECAYANDRITQESEKLETQNAKLRGLLDRALKLMPKRMQDQIRKELEAL